jgi:hypothetical protein
LRDGLLLVRGDAGVADAHSQNSSQCFVLRM